MHLSFGGASAWLSRTERLAVEKHGGGERFARENGSISLLTSEKRHADHGHEENHRGDR